MGAKNSSVYLRKAQLCGARRKQFFFEKKNQKTFVIRAMP
jgi:hypothetical protein